MRAMAVQDRLEPHLRRYGEDRSGTGKQTVGRDGIGQKTDLSVGVGWSEMAGAKAHAGFGMGADQDPLVGEGCASRSQHCRKTGSRCPGMADRSIIAGLVDDQNITRIGCGAVRIKIVVF